MSATLIPWTACQVEIYRYQMIGYTRSRQGSEDFLGDMFLIAR